MPPEKHDIPCVGAVVFDNAGRILLVKRGNEPARGLWSIPGGRVEVGESAEEAVHREIKEETGLVITLTREVGTVFRDAPGGGRYCIRDFLARPTHDQLPVSGDDAAEAGFFTMAQARSLETSEGLIEALTEWGLLGPVDPPDPPDPPDQLG